MKGKNTNRKYEKITISFTEADDDIIEYVRNLKKSNKASEFIREAIREKIYKERSKNDLESTVESLKKRLDNLERLITENISNNKMNFNEFEEEKTIQSNYQEENTTNKTTVERNTEQPNRSNMKLEDDILNNAIDFFEF